jgi:hypothetical protein
MPTSLLLENTFPPLIKLLLFRPALQSRRIEQLSTPDTLIERRYRTAESKETRTNNTGSSEALEAAVTEITA